MAASSTSAKPRTLSKAAATTGPKPAAGKAKPAKNPKPKKPAPKAAKKLSIQDQLTALEARLKRADALTRKNVKTLEQLVASLDTETKSAHSSQKASFTRKVNALNKKLTTIMESNRAAISKDLSAAISTSYDRSETLNELSAALNRSDARLSQAEMSQSEAIRKINRHLANLATALEARFEEEQSARNAAIITSENTLKADIDTKTSALKTAFDAHAAQSEQKLTRLETDMADALETLGSKVEIFATELESRQGRFDTQIGDKISEVALQTQTEFESFRDQINLRLEDISHQVLTATQAESDHVDSSQIDQLDGQMNVLKDRLGALEQYVADINLKPLNQPASAGLQKPSGPSDNIYDPNAALQEAAHLNMPNIAAAPTAIQPGSFLPNPTASNVVQMMDAFAPVATPITPASEALDLQTNPYAQSGELYQNVSLNHAQIQDDPADNGHADDVILPKADTINMAPTPAQPGHIPAEFDPNSYQPVMDLPTLQSAMPAPTTDMAPTIAQAPIIAQPVTTPPPIIATQSQLPPMGSGASFDPPAPQQSFDSIAQTTEPALHMNLDQYSEPSLPYADPAYAESESPRAQRISEPAAGLTGAGLKDKMRLTKGPLGGSPLRFLLMGSAMAIIAIFAGKIILSGEDNYTPITDKTAIHSPANHELSSTGQAGLNPNASLNDDIASNDSSFTINDATQAPIGQYAENVTPDITGADKISLEQAAAKGNAIAQYQLGITYLQASETDPAQLGKAVKLIRAAAAQNLAPAQYRLAKLYEIGQGVQTDASQARQLTERAAKSGHRIAMHDLALYYMDGRGGVDVNVASAEHWFEQAALHGVVDSQFNLAVIAESRKGEDRDIDKAYFWYNIAGKQGDQIAQKRVHTIYEALTPEQIDAAQSRIAAFTPRPVNPEVNGVFQNVPWQSDNQADASNQSVKIERIREAQSYLAELGYEIGPVDGSMGPRTRTAITEFEKLYELPETGTVNDALIDQLELAVGA